MRRLQHNGNVNDMSIPTSVDEDPYETDSDFDTEPVDSSSDDEGQTSLRGRYLSQGPGRCPLQLTRQAKPKPQKVDARMPARSSSRRKARKAPALALIDSAHAIAREISSQDFRGGVEPPPSVVGVRVPRQARRKVRRKCDVSNDGELGFNSKECMKESCSCPRADETQDGRRCTRGPSLSARGPQQMLSRSMS